MLKREKNHYLQIEVMTNLIFTSSARRAERFFEFHGVVLRMFRCDGVVSLAFRMIHMLQLMDTAKLLHKEIGRADSAERLGTKHGLAEFGVRQQRNHTGDNGESGHALDR